jgi:hypothetical protein
MSDFGMFESDEAAQDQPRLAARTAARQLEAAIHTVRRDFGRFLLGATGIDEFGDRWHYSKHDIRAAVEPYIFPNTGTMRRIQNAMKQDWKLAHPYKLAADSTQPASPGSPMADPHFNTNPGPLYGGPISDGQGPINADTGMPTPAGPTVPNMTDVGMADAVGQGRITSNHQRYALSHDEAGFGSMPEGDGPPKNQDLDETYHPSSGNLIPKGDFAGWKDSVDQDGPEKVSGNDFTPGGDSGSDRHARRRQAGEADPDTGRDRELDDQHSWKGKTYRPDHENGGYQVEDHDKKEAARLVADIYTDFARSNGMRVASLDTLDRYASTGIHEADYRLLQALIVRAAEDCEDKDDEDDSDSEDSDSDSDSKAPSASESDDSDDSDDAPDFGGDSASESDDSEDSDSEGGDDYDFGGGTQDSGAAPDAGGQQFTVPEQAPELPPEMMQEIPQDDASGSAPVPPEVIDSLLGLPEGTIEQLLLEEVEQGAQGGDPGMSGPPMPPQGDPGMGGAPQGGGDDFFGEGGDDPEKEPPRVARRRQAKDYGRKCSECKSNNTDYSSSTNDYDCYDCGATFKPYSNPKKSPEKESRRQSARAFWAAEGEQEQESEGGGDSGGGGEQQAAPAQDPAAAMGGMDPAAMGGGMMPPPGSQAVQPPQPPMPLENQPAEDALLDTAGQAIMQMIDRETQEYQQIIGPLSQALQAVQFAQQVEQTENPMDVTPPQGTVNVNPSAAPGGAQNPMQQTAARLQHLTRQAKIQRTLRGAAKVIANTYGVSERMLVEAMGRRHYEHVAEAFRILPPQALQAPEVRAAANHIGKMFAAENKMFNTDVWMQSVVGPRTASTGKDRYQDKAYSQSRDRGREEHERRDLADAQAEDEQNHWEQDPDYRKLYDRNASRGRLPFDQARLAGVRQAGETWKNTSTLDAFEHPKSGQVPEITDNMAINDLPQLTFKGLPKPKKNTARVALDLGTRVRKWMDKQTEMGLNQGGDPMAEKYLQTHKVGPRGQQEVHEAVGAQPHPFVEEPPNPKNNPSKAMNPVTKKGTLGSRVAKFINEHGGYHARDDDDPEHVFTNPRNGEKYMVQHEDGTLFKPGDMLTSFRGNQHALKGISKYPEGPSGGKLHVDDNGSREFYPAVYDAEIVPYTGGWDPDDSQDPMDPRLIGAGRRDATWGEWEPTRQASFFTRKVPGWRWDDHLNGYIS